MPNCFVIMPFRPELHYLYLFMKQDIETAFPGLSCERGDEKVLTVPLLDKIMSYIQEADVVIADCTGRNPNVFYELGIAHALRKPVILITNDAISEVPTDIRAFEFIPYKLDEHKGFLDKLHKALNSVLGSPFEKLYDTVAVLFQEFRTAMNLSVGKVDTDAFAAAAAKVRGGRAFVLDDHKMLAKLFLPLIVDGPIDLDVMQAIKDWITQKFGPDSP